MVEAVELLAALAPTLAEAVRAAARKVYVILDGTLLPIDRIAADRPFCSGKHKKHGQRPSPHRSVRPPVVGLGRAAGAIHDIKAVRTHGIIDALAKADLACWADKGYQGAGGTVRVPFLGKHRNLSTGQQAVNVAHARIRAVGEQAMATLMAWASCGNSAAAPPASPASSRPSCSQAWFAKASPNSPEASSVLFTASFQATISIGALVGGVVVDHSSLSMVTTLAGTAAALMVLVAWSHYARKISWPDPAKP